MEAEAGRTEPLDVIAIPKALTMWRQEWDPQEVTDEVLELQQAGATALAIAMPGADRASFSAGVEALRRVRPARRSDRLSETLVYKVLHRIEGVVMTERELPKIVSVDDHVVEPAHLFETWLPEKYRRPRHRRSSVAASAR